MIVIAITSFIGSLALSAVGGSLATFYYLKRK